jgi:hypothetical protein
MRNVFSLWILAAMVQLSCFGQELTKTPASPSTADSATSSQSVTTSGLPEDPKPSDSSSKEADPAVTTTTGRTAKPAASKGSRLSYYMTETFLNPTVISAPAFRAGLLMANPPGKAPDAYPREWRQGAEAFGRNYGDAFASRVSAHTGQFLAGAMTRESPYYAPSASRRFFARSEHAIVFTFIDRSNSGRPMPALSNFIGAGAGGFVGNAYLPAGFRDVTHAGQRATIQFGSFAAANLFREFAPQIPRPLQIAISLIGR